MSQKKNLAFFVFFGIFVFYYGLLGLFQMIGSHSYSGVFEVYENLGTSITNSNNFVYSVSLHTESAIFKNNSFFTTEIDTASLGNAISLQKFEFIPHNIGLECRLCTRNGPPLENHGHYLGYIETNRNFYSGDTIDVNYSLTIKSIWWQFGLWALLFGGVFACISSLFGVRNPAKKKEQYKLAIMLILIVQCVFLCVLGKQKEVYHCDEIFTYRLSNDFNSTEVHNLQSVHDFFVDKTTVKSGEEFSYGKVYQNQVNDVHPPLYYFVFHTISSFFTGQISKWFGLAINIFFALASSLLFFCLCNKVCKLKIISIIATVFYAFSIGSVGTVMFLRMYSMLVFFSLLYVYLNVLLFESNNNIVKLFLCLGLCATTITGFLTHYYFVVFAGFSSAGFFIYLIIQNFKKTIKFRITIAYFVSIFSGLALSVYLYPAMIQHIFYSYRGVQTYTFNIQEKAQYLKEYLDIIASDFLISLPITIALLVLSVVMLFIPKIRKNIVTAMKNPIIIIFNILCILFVITIAVVAPYQTDRYIFCLYPIIALLIVNIVSAIFSSFKIEQNWIFTAAVMFVFMFFTYATNPIEYKYSEYSDNIIGEIEPYTDDTVIVLTDAEWKLNTVMLDVAEFDKFCIVIGENNVYKTLKRVLNNYTAENLVVYVDSSFFDQEKHLRFAKKPSELQNHVKLYTHEFFNSYLLFK